GVVALVEASPSGYKEVGSFRVPKTAGPSWAHPVVSGGRLYLREGDRLYCYDVRAKGGTPSWHRSGDLGHQQPQVARPGPQDKETGTRRGFRCSRSSARPTATAASATA